MSREFLLWELVGPPPIPPEDYLPKSECLAILSGCKALNNHNGIWSNYTDSCLPVKPSTAAITTVDAAFPAWLIPVIIVAVLVFIVILIVIVICIIKSAKGESPERRADYVLTDYHRVNYLHNKLEKGEKYKRAKRSRSDENPENNNISNGHHTISLPPLSSHSAHEHQSASTGKDYDELSKCYTRQSQELETSCFSEHESPTAERGSRIYTPTIIDGDPEEPKFFTPSIIDMPESVEKESGRRGSNQESPYAISNVLPNVPVNLEDDLPPPAPHRMYANQQFEKLHHGVQNQSFVDDDVVELRSRPLPPNPFPDLRSHTSLYAANLYDNAEEKNIYKKNKKPIPKKRQFKKENV